MEGLWMVERPKKEFENGLWKDETSGLNLGVLVKIKVRKRQLLVRL